MTIRLKSDDRRRGLLREILPLVLLAANFLAACQSSPAPVESETQKSPTSAQVVTATPRSTVRPPIDPTATQSLRIPAEQLEGLQIQFWHPWAGEISREIDLLVDQFNQTNEWGIHVTVHRSGSSMALVQEVDRSAAGGEVLPQVVAAPSEHLLTWLERDQIILPLDSLVSDPVWGLDEKQRAEIALVFWLQDQSHDRQAGIPVQRSAQVLVYNQTWARELGFSTPPQTTETFREQACAAAQALRSDRDPGNDGMGGWILDTDGLTVYSWLKSFELESVVQGDPPVFVFNQPPALQALTYLRGLMDDGCAWIARDPAPYNYFANRQALFYSASLLDLPLQVSAQVRAASQDEWTLLPFPGHPRPTLVVSGLSYGVLRSSETAELAGWLFVRWMSLAENQARILTAGGGLPVSVSAASLAAKDMNKIPQWASVNAWIPIAQPAPQSSGWRVARHVLEDAARQAMQSYISPEQFTEILAELDATIAEVLAQQR